MSPSGLLSSVGRSRLLASSANATALVLGLHVLVWTWVGASLRTNLDLPGDMVEAFVWGEAWQWGYFKHPPLSAWIAGAWFSMMPRGDASYALLSSLNTGLALVGLALLAREFLERRWVVLCVAAATLTPGLTTLSLRFNANAALLVPWAFACAFFVRAMQRGRVRDAMLAGACCAAAVLAKYFAFALIGALGLAALLHAPWRRRALSRTGLIIAVTFLVLLLPHFAWLAAHDYGPLAYAREATGHSSSAGLLPALRFAILMLVYPALGYLVVALACRAANPGFGAGDLLRAIGRPSAHPVWVLAIAPIAATAAITLLAGARTATVWGLPFGMALVLLLCWRLQQSVPRPVAAVGLKWIALAWVFASVAAPLMWAELAREDSPKAGEPRAELARQIDAMWFDQFGTPLRWITGDPTLAASASFYAASRPRYWDLFDSHRRTPWVDPPGVRRDGSAVVCVRADVGCIRAGLAVGGQPNEVDVSKTARGFRFSPRSYTVLFVPPASNEDESPWAF